MNSVEGQPPADENDGASANIQDVTLHGLRRTMGEVPGVKCNLGQSVIPSSISATDAEKICIVGHSVETKKQQDAKERTLEPLVPSLSDSGADLGLQDVGHGDRASYTKSGSSTNDESYLIEPEDTTSSAKGRCSLGTGAGTKAHSREAVIKLPELGEKIDEESDPQREVQIKEADESLGDEGSEEENHVQAISEPPRILPPDSAINLKRCPKNGEQEHLLVETEARDISIASCGEPASGEATNSSPKCENNPSDVASDCPRRHTPSSVPAVEDTAEYDEPVEVANSKAKEPSLSAGKPRGIMKDKDIMDIGEMEKETLMSGMGGSSSLGLPMLSSTGEEYSSADDRSFTHAKHEVSSVRGKETALTDAAPSTAAPNKLSNADFAPDSVGLECVAIAEKVRGKPNASQTTAIKNMATPAAGPVEEASLDSVLSVAEVSNQVRGTRPEAKTSQESGGNVRGEGLVASKNVDEEEVCSFRVGERQHGKLSEPNQIQDMGREAVGSAASASPGDAYAASKGGDGMQEGDALTSEPVVNEEGTNKIAAADLSMEEAEELDDEEGDGDKVECVPFAHCCGELAVGDTVHVDSRTWPGINKHGGAARIRKIYEDADGEGTERNMLYDVSYLLGGSEKGIERRFIHSVNLRSDQAGPRARRKRVFFADEFADDYVPKKRPVEEWQQVVDVPENGEGSLLTQTLTQSRKGGDSAGGKDKMKFRNKGMGEKGLEVTKSSRKGNKRRRQQNQKRNWRKNSVNVAGQLQVQEEALQDGEDEEDLPKGRAQSKSAKNGQIARLLDSDETENSEESGESADDHEEDVEEDEDREGGEMNKRSQAGKCGDRRGKHTDEGVSHDLQSSSRSDPWLDISSPSLDAYASSSASYSDAGGSLEEGEEEADSEIEDDDSLDDDNFIQPEDDASELPEDVQAKTGFRLAGSKEGLRRQLQQGQQNLLSLLNAARQRQSRINQLMSQNSASEDLDKAEKELLSLEVFHLHRMVRGGVDVVEAVLRKLSKRRCRLPERVELLFDRQEAEVMEQGRWIRRQKEELATLKDRLGIPHIHFEADAEDFRENSHSKRDTERRNVGKKKSKRDKSGGESEEYRRGGRKAKSDKSKRGSWSERDALSAKNNVNTGVVEVVDGEEGDRMIFDSVRSDSTCSDSPLEEEEEGDGEDEEILLDPFSDLLADKSVEGDLTEAGLKDGVNPRRQGAGSARKTTGRKRSRKAMEESWVPLSSVSSQAKSRQYRTRPSRQGRERYNRERRGEPDPFLHRSLAENRGWARRATERPQLLWPPPLHSHSVSSPRPSSSSYSTPSSTLLSTSRADLEGSFIHPPRETALERLWRQQDRRQRARAGAQRPSGPHAGAGVAVHEAVWGQRGAHPIQATGGESSERVRGQRTSADADPLGLLSWPTLSQPKPFVAADVLPAPAASLVRAQARWRRVTEYWTLPKGVFSTAASAVAPPPPTITIGKTVRDSDSSRKEEQDHTPAGTKDVVCQEIKTVRGEADPSSPGINNVEQQSHEASLEGKLQTKESSDTSSEPPWSELWGSLLEEALSRALRTGLRAITRRLSQLRRVSAGHRPSENRDLVGQVEEILHVLYRRLDDSLELFASGDKGQIAQQETVKEKEEYKTTEGFTQRTSQTSFRTPFPAERILEADLAVAVWREEVPELLRALSSPRRIQSELQTLPTNEAESIERDNLSRELVSTLRVLLWAFKSARRISRAGLCARLLSSESEPVSGGGRQGEDKGEPCHPPDSADALLALAAASATCLVELHMEGSGALRGALGEVSSYAFGPSGGEEDVSSGSLTPQRRLERATEEAVLSLWLDLAEWSAGEWCAPTQVERAANAVGASGGSMWLLLRWVSPLLHASLCRRLSQHQQHENQTETRPSKPVAEIWWLMSGAEALRRGVFARSRESSRTCTEIKMGEAQSPAERQWRETLRTAMGGLCCLASRSWEADGREVVASGETAGARPCSPPSSSSSTFTSSAPASPSSSSAYSISSSPSSCCCCFSCWHDGADLLRRLDPEVDLVQSLLPLPSHAMSSCDPQHHWEEAKVVSEVVWDVTLLLRRSPLTVPWTGAEACEGPPGSSPSPGGSIQPQPRPKPLCDPSADSALHQLLCFLLLWSPLGQGGANSGKELSARVLGRRQRRALQRHTDSVRSVLRRLAGLWVVSPPSSWSALTVSSECLAWLFRRLMAVGELWTETDDMNDETELQWTAGGRGGPQWLNAHLSLWRNSTDAPETASRRSSSNNSEEDREQLVYHIQGAGVLSALCTMLALLLRSVTKPVMRKKLYGKFLRCLPERPMVDAEPQPQWLGGSGGPPRAAGTETTQVASAPSTTTRNAPPAGEGAFGRGGREGHADRFTSLWHSTAAESMTNAGTGTGTIIGQGAGKGSRTGTSTSTGTVTGATRSAGPSAAPTALQSLPRGTSGSLIGQAVTSTGDASAPKGVCEPVFCSSAQLAAASAVLVTLCESLSPRVAEDARARQLLQSWGKKLASLPTLTLPSTRGCRVVSRSGWVEGAQRVAQLRLATGEDFAEAAAPILQTLRQLLRSLRGEAETLRERGAGGGGPSGCTSSSAGNARATEEAAELVQGCWTVLAELLRDCAEARQRRPLGSTVSPAGKGDCPVADGSGSTAQLQAVVAIAPLLGDCLLPEMSRLLPLPSVFSVLGLVRSAIELVLPPLEDVEVSEERSAAESRLAAMDTAFSGTPASMRGPSLPSGPEPSGNKDIAGAASAPSEPEDEFAMDSALEAALASVDVDAAVLEHLQLTQQPNPSPSTALHPPQNLQISRQRTDGRWEEAHQAAVLALSGLKAPLMKLLSRLYEPWSAVESFKGALSRSRKAEDRSTSCRFGYVLPQEESSHSERASFEFCQPQAVVELERHTLSALSGLLALGCYAAERAHCWAEIAAQFGCARLSLWTAAQRRGLGEELPLRVFWALWELADRPGRLSLLRTPLPFLATPRAVPGSAESTAAPRGHYAVYLWVRAAMHYRLYGQVPSLAAESQSGGASEGAPGHLARHAWRRLSHVVQRLLTSHHSMAAAVHGDLRLAAAAVGSALEGGACGLPGCDLTCSGARLAAVEALLVATARRWTTLAHGRRSTEAQSLRLVWMDARKGLLAVAAGEVRQALLSLLAAWHRRRERAQREPQRPSEAHPSSGVSSSASSSASKGRVRRGEWLSAMEVREGVAAAVVHWLSLLGLLLRHIGAVGGGGGALGSNHFLRPVLAEDCPAASHKGYTLSTRYFALPGGGTTAAAGTEALRRYASRTAASAGTTDGDAARQAEPSGAVTVDQRFEEAMTRLRRQREGFRGAGNATRVSHVGGGGNSQGRTSSSGVNTGGNGAETGEGERVLWEIKGANFCSDLQVVLFPELMRYFAETADTYQLFGGGWARSHCRSFLQRLLQPPSFLGFGAYAPYLLGTEVAADQSVETELSTELDSNKPEGAGRMLKSRVLGLALGRAVACGLICGSTCPATARALNTAVKSLLPPEAGCAPRLYFSSACAADKVVSGSSEPTDSTAKTATCLNGCGWDLGYVDMEAGGRGASAASESDGECLGLSGEAPTRSQARVGVGLSTLCAACRRRRRLLEHLLGPGLGQLVDPSSVSHLLPALRLLHSLLQHASADLSCLRYTLLVAQGLWQRLLSPQGALGVRRLFGPGARFARPLLACVSLVVACTELALPVLRPEEPAAAYVELPVLIAAAVARALRHSSAAAHGTEEEALVAAWRKRTDALAATTCPGAAWTEEGAEEASLGSTQTSATQSAAREAADEGEGPAPDFLSDLILPVVEEVHGHQRDKQSVLDRCRSLLACINSCGVQSWRDLAERFLKPSL